MLSQWIGKSMKVGESLESGRQKSLKPNVECVIVNWLGGQTQSPGNKHTPFFALIMSFAMKGGGISWGAQFTNLRILVRWNDMGKNQAAVAPKRQLMTQYHVAKHVKRLGRSTT